MHSKRIWIVSEIYYPVKTSTGYYMTEIAEYLAYRGLDVHVICTNSTYNEGESESITKEEVYKGVHVHRVSTVSIDKNNFLKRILRLSVSSCCLFFRILSSVHNGDRILVVTNPAFLLLIMPFIAWWKKITYTVLVHDIFPENLVAIKKISSLSPVYKCLKFFFDRAYSKSECCISIGRDMSEVLCNKLHMGSNIQLIPIWSQNEEIFPRDKRETSLCKNLLLEDKFVFQFAGNLGHAQGIDNLLEAIDMIDNENIHFLFIGGGAKTSEISSFIKTKCHKNISLVGFQDRSQQDDFLNSCDVGIVTLNDGMFGLGVPSKSYNIMAAGKPILYIGDTNSEIALCIKEYTMGWVVEPNNPYALKNMMEYIYKNRNNLDSIRNNARTTADTVFARTKILEKYYSLFI